LCLLKPAPLHPATAPAGVVPPHCLLHDFGEIWPSRQAGMHGGPNMPNTVRLPRGSENQRTRQHRHPEQLRHGRGGVCRGETWLRWACGPGSDDSGGRPGSSARGCRRAGAGCAGRDLASARYGRVRLRSCRRGHGRHTDARHASGRCELPPAGMLRLRRDGVQQWPAAALSCALRMLTSLASWSV
jgi:hypothetical protein